MGIAAVAACLCLVILGGFLLANRGRTQPPGAEPGGIHMGEQFTVASAPQNHYGVLVPQATEPVTAQTEPPGATECITPGSAQYFPPEGTEPPGTTAEVPSVILQVEAWSDGVLWATVHAHVDTDAVPLGQKLRVYFAEDCRIDPESCPPGTLLQVMFFDYDGESLWTEAVSPVS